jgi:integrase
MKLKYVAYSIKKAADGSRVKYYYYRRPNQPAVALGSDPARVIERHAVLEAQYNAAATVAVRRAGTVGELIGAYYASTEWKALADSTKALWRLSFRDLEERLGVRPPAAITSAVTYALKEKLIKLGHGPGAVRNRIAAYRVLWSWGVRPAGLLPEGPNPWSKPGSFGEPRKTRPGRLWEQTHIDAFLAARRRVKIGGNPKFTDPARENELAPPPAMRLAVLLGLASVQRLGDVLKLTGRNIEDRGGRYWLALKQSKTKTEVSFPILSIAQDELRAQGIAPGDDRFLIRSKSGLPFETRSFAKAFKIWTAAAGLHHTFKDLRSSGMVWLSRAGADVTLIVSISGHSIEATQEILDTYIKRNEKSAEIAVNKLEAALTPATPVPASRATLRRQSAKHRQKASQPRA